MSTFGAKLSKKLRNLRKAKGQTQQWLASLSGLSRATINRWETQGAGSVTLDELELVSQKLGISISELLELQSAGTHSLAECIDAVRAATGGQELIPAPILAEITALSPKQKTAVFEVLKAAIRGDFKPSEYSDDEKECIELMKSASASNRRTIIAQLRLLARNNKKDSRSGNG